VNKAENLVVSRFGGELLAQGPIFAIMLKVNKPFYTRLLEAVVKLLSGLFINHLTKGDV